MAPVVVDERLGKPYVHVSIFVGAKTDERCVSKVGQRGLALRGPQMFADESGASDGKPGEMTMSDGKLSPKPRFRAG